MKIGVQIPNTGDQPREIGLVKMGQLAEDAGADSIWVNDHILMVKDRRSHYPYTSDGVPWWPLDMPWYECLTAASFLAATTHTCKIGTSVLVLPQRRVLELAKTTATLDALSGGRLVLGIGVGWFAEEIEALGYRFKTRGRRTDEMIEALRRCWTGNPQPFNGEEIVVPEGLIFQPQPSTPSGPPILVGGISRAALRRAAALGDGWLAFQKGKLDLQRLAELLKILEELRDEAGRLSEPFHYVLRLSYPELVPQLPDLAIQVQKLGFNELIIEPPWSDLIKVENLIGNVKSAVRATDTISDG